MKSSAKKKNYRKGRFDKDEQDFIFENYRHLTVREIARQLNRREYSVEKFIASKVVPTENASSAREESFDYVTDITDRPYWEQFKKQFNDSELGLIKYHWKQITSQFRQTDILPTEELQILDAIKLEVLMSRTLDEQRQLMNNIEHLEKELNAEEESSSDGPKTQEEKDRIFTLRQQIEFARNTLQGCHKKYKELQAEKQKMMGAISGSRDQRVKSIENSKTSFMDWMKQLIKDDKYRREVGEELAKMRKAVEKEEERLSQSHKYIDDTVDIPLLTPENVEQSS